MNVVILLDGLKIKKGEKKEATYTWMGHPSKVLVWESALLVSTFHSLEQASRHNDAVALLLTW